MSQEEKIDEIFVPTLSRSWGIQIAWYKTDKTGLEPFLQNALKTSCLNFRISSFLVKSNKTHKLTGLN